MSRFSRVNTPRPSRRALAGDVITVLGGLDLVNAYDNMAPGRTPDAANFRINKQTQGDRQVAISTRKGQGYYTRPLGEHVSTASVSTDGNGVVTVGVEENIHAQPFIALHNEHLTRLDLRSSLGSSTSVLRVDIYDDDNDFPGKLLASSSFVDISDEVGYNTARFVNAPLLESGDKYWFVLYLQDDGTGYANLSTTTSPEDGLAHAGNSLVGVVEQPYGLNYEIYTSPDVDVMQSYRFNREDGVNRTLVPIGTTMYMIDGDGYKPIVTGLSANATDYSFTDGDGKVFWVNGQDDLMAWDGQFEDEAPNLVLNPSLDTNTSGWEGVGGAALTRAVAEFNSAPASLQVATTTTAETGTKYQFPFEAHKRYKISFWAKSAAASRNIFFRFTANQDIALENLSTTWKKYEFYYTPTSNDTASTRGAVFRFNNIVGNVWIDDVEIKYSGVENITSPTLPILSQITFHKDRLMGVTVADKNRIVFSENPGNPSNSPATQQWYYAWLSVSFIYVPRPFNGSPITSIISFQNSLIITTKDSKYVLSGDDRGNYYLRQSTGSKGAISRRGVISDPNYIYFVSDDGIYQFNGAKDEKISDLVQPLIDSCPRKHEISLALWKDQLRVYMASEFSTVSDITLILDSSFGEWMLDTDTYVNRAIYYSDSDDQMELVEFSSQTGTAYYAETDYNALGGPIDFRYALRYDSRGMPGQRKKFKKYVPLVQAVGKSFPITLGNDRDFEDEPRETTQELSVGGATIGDFFIDDGTIITGKTAFKPKKTSVSGYSYYMQFRVSRKAVNNQVAFMGVQFTYKAKRL